MANPGDTAATFCATLAAQWEQMGVDQVVIAPGSRSTPLALALVSNGWFDISVFHDERSAAFAALGIGMASRRPAVLVCSSGTAATHFHAAIVEAHQSNVPMIVCTADRPPELRDVSAPQTIDQAKLYGNAVRWFHDPGVPSNDARDSWRSLAARAYEAATGLRPGPVHLNIPFREPLTGLVGLLPPALPEREHAVPMDVGADSEMLVERMSGRRGVIVVGRDMHWTGSERSSVLDLADALGWPVLGDARSRGRCTVARADLILRSEKFARAHQPDVVLRIGEIPASKVLSQWVARSGAEILQIQPTESVVEPEWRNSATVVGVAETVCGRLAPLVRPCSPVWRADWERAQDVAESALSGALTEWSEPACARVVTEMLAAHRNLMVSSSMPIRDVEWYGARTPAKTFSNRGANGIDGVVATAIGISQHSHERTVVYIGDVALVHDSSSLVGLGTRGVDLTIIVTNNDGGSIFSFLPQAEVVEANLFEQIYGTPHGTDFAHLAAAHGIGHVQVASADELRDAIGQALKYRGVNLIEARFDRGTNVAVHDRINATVVAAVDLAV